MQSAASLAKLDTYKVVPIEAPRTARARLLNQLLRLIFQVDVEQQYSTRGAGLQQAADTLLGRETLEAIGMLNDPLHTYSLCLVCTEP